MLSRWPPALARSKQSALSAAAWSVAAVTALGPLELRHAMVPLFGLQVSSVEVLAGVALLCNGWAAFTLRRDPLVRRGVRRPIALALVLWALVHVASALWSDAPAYSLKFGLRVVGGIGLAVSCATFGALRRYRRTVAVGVMSGLLLVTLIAGVERALGQASEPFLQWFRDEPTWMLGEPRLSTVFYHANTLAAFLELTFPFVLVAACLPVVSRRQRVAMALWAFACAAMLSLTYSRAGLLAGVLASLCLGWSARRVLDRGRLARAAFAFAALLSVAYLGNPDMRARLGFGKREYRVDYAFDGPCEGGRAATVQVPVTVTNEGEWPLSDRHAPGELGWLIWPREGKPDPRAFSYRKLPVLDRGATFQTTLDVHLPDIAGPWELVLDIRRKGVIWLSATGTEVGRATCVVTPGADDPKGTPHTLSRAAIQLQTRPLELARKHYWQAALRLFEARPWLGHGADRFRYQYRGWVPDKAWDGRARAHSLVLETAADLGLLGLLALGLLLGTLAPIFVTRLLAGAPQSPIALAATVACLGFGLHSMVDYFLAYTQILLVAWPVLGLAAAQAPESTS